MFTTMIEQNGENYSIEELEAEINQEKMMKNMLDQSISDLQETVNDLERKFDQVDTEGNEWKTRFETQQEMNRQLERQLEILKDKIQLHNGPNKKGVVLRNFEEMTDTGLKGLVKQFEKEKSGLEGQLRDMEWRLDQESKALHKANEGRKKYVTELMEANFHIDSYERLQGKRKRTKLAPTKTEPRRRVPKTNKHDKN